MTKSKAHILIFPFPAQGHMLPLIDFTHQLSNKGLDITILVTPKNLHLLSPFLSKNPSVQTLVLPFPSHPSIPPGVENVKDLPVVGLPTMIHALSNLRNPIKEWFNMHPSPPTAIIADFFLGWTNSLASELNIAWYVFSPSGSLTLGILCSLWRDFPKRKDPFNDEEMISFPKVPKCPIYPWGQISPLYRSFVANERDPVSKTIKETFVGNMASFGLVINTVLELEKVYVDHLKEILGNERVWPVGPVLPPHDDLSGQADQRGGENSILCSEILKWLDECEDHGSVIFVCFGSQAVLTNKQMEALVLGLEKSGAKFILCVKGATKGHEDVQKYGQIPSGFEERGAGRGVVIKGWVPQVSILRHCAVGAFLTHCGWNSVLEGIVAGVPMLAWPMTADQYANATLIVDELKIGVRVCEGEKTVPNSDEMASVLANAKSKFLEARRRAKTVHKAALDAVQEGGSSFKNLENLVLHLSAEASKCKN